MATLDFNTTAALQAYVFGQNDVYSFVARDLQKGSAYHVIAAGSGSTVLSALPNSPFRYIELSLNLFKLVNGTSDVGAIAAIGGLGASDSAPILRGDAANSVEWSWATGNVVALGLDTSLRADFDGSFDSYLELDVYSGSTDKASMTVALCCDGGTETSYTADDTATKSATNHTITATLLAADVPDSVKKMSIRITPATAHSTNAYQLTRARLKYVAK